MIIRKGMEFLDESGDYRIIRIEEKHFGAFAVSIWKPAYDENGEPLDELIYDYDTIMTAAEIRILVHAKHINFEDEEEEA